MQYTCYSSLGDMIAKEQNARAQIIEQVDETQRKNQDKLPIVDDKPIDGQQL